MQLAITCKLGCFAAGLGFATRWCCLSETKMSASKKSEKFAYIRKVLRPHHKRLAVGTATMLGITVIDLGSPLVIAVIIDDVIGRGQYSLLPGLMMFFLMLPLAAALCRFVSNYTISLLGQRVIFDIRLSLYKHVQKLHCRYLQNTTTGKLTERLRGDVLQLQTLLTNQAPQLMVQVVTGLIMLVIMFFMSVKLTLLVLAGMAVYYINYRWHVPRIRKIQRRYRHKMDHLSGLAQERLSGTIVVKAFGRERQETRGFLRRNFAAERVFHRMRNLSVRYSVLSSLLTWGTYSAVIFYGTVLAVHGEITYGMVTAVTAFAMRLLMPAAMLAELANQLQQASVALDRIFELMRAEPDVINQPGLKLPKLAGEVCFRNVFFQYEPNKPVLQNLDLTVRQGKTVALVGQTGCGKSTIINLLYRYYDVDSGEITVDGQDVRSFDTRWYRRNLAIVPQEPIILDATVEENISYGQPNAGRKQIEKAARMAELGELIDQLPGGLQTLLGDEGVKLSVGEKQRLCIARAILADPAILILDEATSSLDTRSEAMIQLAMRRIMARRTSFVVAHRLSTIVNADLIVVLAAGRVVEMGNHPQLMERPGGKYRQLYLTQTASTPRRSIG